MITEYHINNKLIVCFAFLMAMGLFSLGFIEASSIKVQIIPDEEGFLGGKKSDLADFKQHELSMPSSENIFGDEEGLKGVIRKMPPKINDEKNYEQFGIKGGTFKGAGIESLGNFETYTAILCKLVIENLSRKGVNVVDKDANLQIHITINKIGPSCFSEYPPITEVVYKAMQDKKELFSGSFHQNYDCHFHLNPLYSAKSSKQVAAILGKDILKRLNNAIKSPDRF